MIYLFNWLINLILESIFRQITCHFQDSTGGESEKQRTQRKKNIKFTYIYYIYRNARAIICCISNQNSHRFSGSKNYPSTLYSSFPSFFFALWKTTLELLLATSCSTLSLVYMLLDSALYFFQIFIFLKNEKIYMNFS